MYALQSTDVYVDAAPELKTSKLFLSIFQS